MTLISCPAPGCQERHEADDLVAQSQHMQAYHPEIIEQRLTEAGFVRDPVTGTWIDTLAHDG